MVFGSSGVRELPEAATVDAEGLREKNPGPGGAGLILQQVEVLEGAAGIKKHNRRRRLYDPSIDQPS